MVKGTGRGARVLEGHVAWACGSIRVGCGRSRPEEGRGRVVKRREPLRTVRVVAEARSGRAVWVRAGAVVAGPEPVRWNRA